MKGLIIKDPWITKILNGEKTWEIRGSNTKMRGTIALIKSGTGLVYGTAELVNSFHVDIETYIGWRSHHQIPDGEGKFPHYDNMYAWVLTNPFTFSKPLPYKHPQGAVIWVNLDKEAM